MTDQPPLPFLHPSGSDGPPWQCEIGEDEARETLRYAASCPTGNSPEICAIVRRQMETLLRLYAEGSVAHAARFSVREHAGVQSISGAPIDAAAKIAEEPSPIPQELPPFPTIPDRRVELPSPMDFEALRSSEQVGGIDPPGPGSLPFLSEELRIPVPTGTVSAVSAVRDDLPVSPFAPPSASATPSATSLTRIVQPWRHATQTAPLWIPLGMQVSGEGKNMQAIARPGASDPFITRARRERQSAEVTYAIAEPVHDSLPHADLQSVAVSEAEQAYWQAALPLPDTLRRKILSEIAANRQEEVIHLLLANMHQEYRYVCHDAFGEFLRENADDLPLIMQILRRGHCDLLAWVFAAKLRGVGIPAWVIPAMVSTPDGTAFRACGHAVTGVSLGNRDVTCDPTTVCSFDPAYHPAALTDNTVKKLNEAFTDCDTPKGKQEVLRAFADDRTRSREQATKNSPILRDILSLAGFLHEKKISPWAITRKHTIGGALRGWIPLPEKMDPEGMFAVLSAVDDNGLSLHFSGPQAAYVSRTMRETYAWFAAACHTQGMLPETYFPIDARAFSRNEQQAPEGSPIEQLDAWLDRGKTLTPEQLIALADHEFANFNVTLSCTDLCMKNDMHRLVTGIPAYLSSYTFSTAFQQMLKQVQSIGEREAINLSAQHASHKEKKQLIRDLWIFCTSLMHALAGSREVKSMLSQSLGMDAATLRSIIRALCPLRIRNGSAGTPARTLPPAARGCLQAVRAMLLTYEVDQHCEARVGKAVEHAVQRLYAGEAGGWNKSETRPYVPGDAWNTIDWNATARLDALFARGAPDRWADRPSPLTVILDETMHWDVRDAYLWLSSVIRALQRLSRSLQMPVHCVLPDEGIPYLLPNNRSASAIVAALTTAPFRKHVQDPTDSQPWITPHGRVLLLTSSHGNALMAQELYGRAIPFQSIVRSDHDVYPLCRPTWVENGLPQELRDVLSMTLKQTLAL